MFTFFFNGFPTVECILMFIYRPLKLCRFHARFNSTREMVNYLSSRTRDCLNQRKKEKKAIKINFTRYILCKYIYPNHNSKYLTAPIVNLQTPLRDRSIQSLAYQSVDKKRVLFLFWGFFLKWTLVFSCTISNDSKFLAMLASLIRADITNWAKWTVSESKRFSGFSPGSRRQQFSPRLPLWGVSGAG